MKSDAELSDLALANVEALAQGESHNGGYSSVTIFEIGTENMCENGIYYVITYYGSDCSGEGSLSCPGYSCSVREQGYCV